jgi:RNA polymerase sigma-70 factor (ECF subfamily)
MALTEVDRDLLKACLDRQPHAWERFVDRFLGLVVHAINHTAQSCSLRLSRHDREDLASDVFLTVVDDNFRVLRGFRGQSSLATYPISRQLHRASGDHE